MKKIRTLNGNKLYVTRVRIVISKEDIKNGGGLETAHYNQLGFRLFYKLRENRYLDILDNKVYKTLNDKLQPHELFIFNPKPFSKYAYNLRINEGVEDVFLYAHFVADYFNAHMHDEKKWYNVKDYVHKIHHNNDKEILENINNE